MMIENSSASVFKKMQNESPFQTNVKRHTSVRQHYDKMEDYQLGNVHCLRLISVYICHLFPSAGTATCHQKGRVGSILLSLQRIVNAVTPKPFAVKR